MFRRVMMLSACVCLCALSQSCDAADEPSFLRVTFVSSLTVPDDFTTLKVTAIASDGASSYQELELPNGTIFPQSMVLRSERGHSGTISIRVDVFQGLTQRMRRNVDARLERGKKLDLLILLDQSCLDVACLREEEDCVSGICATQQGANVGDGGI